MTYDDKEEEHWDTVSDDWSPIIMICGVCVVLFLVLMYLYRRKLK